MSEQDALVEALLKWCNEYVDSEEERKTAKRPPPPPPPVYESMNDVDFCKWCLTTRSCQRDFEGIEFGKWPTEHGLNVAGCPHLALENGGKPPIGAICWFCGGGDCDDYLTVTVVDFHNANRHILNDQLRHVEGFMHDTCYDLYFSENGHEPPVHPLMQIIPKDYEEIIVDYLRGVFNADRH